MPERYLWVPWHTGAKGNLLPDDFNTIGDKYASDGVRRRQNALQILDGVGRLIVVQGSTGYVNDLASMPETIEVSSTYQGMLSWVESDRNARAVDVRNQIDKVLRPLRGETRSLADSIPRFCPDQLRKSGPPRIPGTFTEAFTGTDTDPWPSDWTQQLYDTLDFDSPTSTPTVEIQSNEGAIDGPTGGAFRRRGTLMFYNGDSAADQDVKADNMEAADSFLAGLWVRAQTANGSAYEAESFSQSGDDSRLNRIVNEVRTADIATDSTARSAEQSIRSVVSNDGSNDPVLDLSFWQVGTSEPGSPTFSHTDTDAAALTGNSTDRGGIYVGAQRDDVTAWDNFEFTNNDTPAAATAIRRNLATLGVGR